jgi:hypothetical protein
MRITALLRVLGAALAFVVMAAGVSACGSSSADDLATATRLVDEWAAAWNNHDRDALAAIFTEDATVVYTGVHNSTATGRDEIAANPSIGRVRNVDCGEVRAIEDGSFTCQGTYEGAGAPFVSELTFELDGDLISHLVHHDQLVIPGTSAG